MIKNDFRINKRKREIFIKDIPKITFSITA